MTHTLPREMTWAIESALKTFPVVVVTGMRQVGKSTLLQKAPEFRHRRFTTLDDFAELEEAKSSPDTFLDRGGPLTIDEAQRCPELLVAVKIAFPAASCFPVPPTSRFSRTSPKVLQAGRFTCRCNPSQGARSPAKSVPTRF